MLWVLSGAILNVVRWCEVDTMIRQLEELLGIIPLAVGARMKSTGVWEPSLPVLPTVIFK